ncbi:MAG: orotate phosphoribosyltransferase [Candidatus Micrarchaeia archaeon]
MEAEKKEFIEFLYSVGALQIGDFTLKSGRKSPYFFNAGIFNTGRASYELGKHFARLVKSRLGEEYDVIFGPAYKGIPLAVSTSIAAYKEFGAAKGWVFNRKEAKEHGDKGAYVGSQIKDGTRVVLVDDVFTTGGTKEEAITQLRSIAKVEIKGVFIAVDRAEVNADGKDAIKEFAAAFGVPVYSIVNVHDIFAHLHKRRLDGKIAVSDADYKNYQEYKEKYCIKEDGAPQQA